LVDLCSYVQAEAGPEEGCHGCRESFVDQVSEAGMDNHTVLEAFDEDKLIRWDPRFGALRGESRLGSVNLAFFQETLRNYSIREESSSPTYFLRDIDLDRNHVSFPSWNSGQAWRGRLHFDVILLLVAGKQLPSLTVQDELCPARASSSDKVLVQTSDTPLTKEVEYSVLLNVRYD